VSFLGLTLFCWSYPKQKGDNRETTGRPQADPRERERETEGNEGDRGRQGETEGEIEGDHLAQQGKEGEDK
jgi:hypothetical protein